MFTRIALCLPLLSLSLLAQGEGLLTTLTPQQRTNITHNAGLRPDGTDRLLGGGADYQVTLTRSGMLFHPALGATVATLQHLHLQPLSVSRGAAQALELSQAAAPRQDELRASYAHGRGIEERYDVGPDGVELSWQFQQRPAGTGDLVVRYAVDTSLPTPTADQDGGLQFVIPGIGGVAIGGVTGIDATGAEIAGQLRYAAGQLELSLPADFVDNATYPRFGSNDRRKDLCRHVDLARCRTGRGLRQLE